MSTKKSKTLKRAVALVTAFALFPASAVFAVTGVSTTPVLPRNEDGNQGMAVFSSTITDAQAGQTFGVRISDFTDGMNQINLSINVDGNAQWWAGNLRPGAAIPFTLPAGSAGQEFAIKASTNATGTGANAGVPFEGSFTLEFVEPAVGNFDFVPGTYTAQSTLGGWEGAGDLTVSVTVDATSIVSIDVLEYFDSTNWFIRVDPHLINSVILAQSTDVDVITSATFSSNGLLEAINTALNQAATGNGGAEQPEPPAENGGAVEGLADGVFEGTASSFGGPLTVQVTVEGGQIVSVEYLEISDTPMWIDMVFPALPEAIIQAQGTDVDIITGATVTSTALLEAVSNALGQ